MEMESPMMRTLGSLGFTLILHFPAISCFGVKGLGFSFSLVVGVAVQLSVVNVRMRLIVSRCDFVMVWYFVKG